MKKQQNNGKITALYERLSRDDEQKNESISIAHQKQILEDYARKNGFHNIRHFTDDGVTGTVWKAQKNGQRREYYHKQKADSLPEAANQ